MFYHIIPTKIENNGYLKLKKQKQRDNNKP